MFFFLFERQVLYGVKHCILIFLCVSLVVQDGAAVTQSWWEGNNWEPGLFAGKKTFGEKSQKMLIVTSRSFNTTFTREETMNHFAEKHLTVVYCTNRTAENKGVYEVEL